MGRERPPYEARPRWRRRLERFAAIRFKRLQEEEPNQYCHQTAAELFRWSASLYFCNGVRIRYGDHEYYVRLMAAKAMMQRQKPWLVLMPRRNSLTAPHHSLKARPVKHSRWKKVVSEWTKAANRKRM